MTVSIPASRYDLGIAQHGVDDPAIDAAVAAARRTGQRRQVQDADDRGQSRESGMGGINSVRNSRRRRRRAEKISIKIANIV